MQITAVNSVTHSQLKSECMQRCYDNKWTIVGSVFTGASGAGLVVGLSSTAKNSFPPEYVAIAAVGATLFGAFFGGTLGKVADLMLSRNFISSVMNSQPT